MKKTKFKERRWPYYIGQVMSLSSGEFRIYGQDGWISCDNRQELEEEKRKIESFLKSKPKNTI